MLVQVDAPRALSWSLVIHQDYVHVMGGFVRHPGWHCFEVLHVLISDSGFEKETTSSCQALKTGLSGRTCASVGCTQWGSL